jgi:hypothetical protein
MNIIFILFVFLVSIPNTIAECKIINNCAEYPSYQLGDRTTASGYNSMAMGASTTASGDYSTAMGASTTASGHYSTAMGASTTASGDYSMAMGKYNKIDATSLLVVGNGTSSERNNAFEVKNNGIIIGNANNMTVDNINLLDIINKQQQQIEELLQYIRPMQSCNCSVGLLQCDNVSEVVNSYKRLNQCRL